MIPEDEADFAAEADAALAEFGGPPVDMTDAHLRLRRSAWVYKKVKAQRDAAVADREAEAEAARDLADDLEVAEAEIDDLRQALSLAVTARDQWEANAERALDILDRVRALPRYKVPGLGAAPGVVVRADQLAAALVEAADELEEQQ